MARDLVLRLAHPEDYERIVDYCQKHQHQFFALRKEQTARAAAGDGAFTIEERGEIVGTSCNFLLSGRRDAADVDWVEIGQSRITLNGLCLFAVLTCVQTLHAYRCRPEVPFVFAQVDAPNARVSRLFAQLGFEQFEPAEVLEQASVSSLPLDKRPPALGYGFVWWRLERSGLHGLKRTLTEVLREFLRRAGDQYRLVGSPELEPYLDLASSR
jgi:hypothetical protein